MTTPVLVHVTQTDLDNHVIENQNEVSNVIVVVDTTVSEIDTLRTQSESFDIDAFYRLQLETFATLSRDVGPDVRETWLSAVTTRFRRALTTACYLSGWEIPRDAVLIDNITMMAIMKLTVSIRKLQAENAAEDTADEEAFRKLQAEDTAEALDS